MLRKEDIIKKIKENKFNSPGSGHGKLYQEIAFDEFKEGLPEPQRKENFYRYNQILYDVGQLKDKVVLDIGCNLGYFAFKLNESGAICIGIDPDNESIEIANLIKEYKKIENLEFIKSELNQNIIDYIITKYQNIDIILLLSVNHWLLSSIQSRFKLDNLLRNLVTNDQIVFYEPSFSHSKGAYYPETVTKKYVINFLMNIGYNNIKLIGSNYATNVKIRRRLWKAELDIKSMSLDCISRLDNTKICFYKRKSYLQNDNKNAFIFNNEKGRAIGYYYGYFVKIVDKNHERFFSYENESEILKFLRGNNFCPHFYFSTDVNQFRLYFYSKISATPLNKIKKYNYSDFFIDLEEKIINILRNLENKGILYRDLRPDNLLYNENTNRVYLVDFQWARFDYKEIKFITDKDEDTLKIALNKIKNNEYSIIESKFSHESNIITAQNIIQKLKKNIFNKGAIFRKITKKITSSLKNFKIITNWLM